MTKNVLVYNNNTGIAEIMKPLFAGEEIMMAAAAGVEELLRKLKEEDIHLLLIDVELDGHGWGGGIEMIQYLRTHTLIPIIVISAQMAEAAKIMALEAGADDYMTVEDHPLVLLARVKSHLRRYTQLMAPGTDMDAVYRVGNIEIDDRCHMVRVEGRDVKMTPIEYKILRLLIQEQGKVLSIDQIYESIWQMKAVRVDNTIAVHIRHIREKIENNPQKPCYLKVVRGMGYKVG